MPSPFPGMDPYLEDPAFWRDFHSRFINACSDQLMERLPDTYEARICERVRVLHVLPGVNTHQDFDFADLDPSLPASVVGTTLMPVVIPMLPTEEVRDRWIEVLHGCRQSRVTVIELLSPSDKTIYRCGDYSAKRRSVIDDDKNLVELDLSLQGDRIPLGGPLPRDDYYALVTRASCRSSVDVYHWSVRDRLPVIPVPLRSGDPEAPLDLAAVFATTYERGRYARSLRYGAPLAAPLSSDDAAWATNLVKAGA